MRPLHRQRAADRGRPDAGFSMVELLVSVTLMSVMTAVLLQSFVVARRLNARASTEQRMQALAESAMESMKAMSITLRELEEQAEESGSITEGGLIYQAGKRDGVLTLVCSDIGNGRGPMVSFGRQYGVRVELDPTPYESRRKLGVRDGSDLVRSFNTDPGPGGSPRAEKLLQLRVIIYRMDEPRAASGEEQLRLESARLMDVG